MLDLGVSAKTRANCRGTLAQFFKWSCKRENFKMPDMPDVQFELGWRNTIDMHTQTAIIEHIKKICPDFKVYLGIRWLATYVAIRPNEMRNLKERHINVNGFFVIPSPKEKKPKLVPMLQEDIDLIESMPRGLPDLYFFRHQKGNGAAKPGQQYGKDNFYRWWKRACKELGIEGMDLYGGTRHSSASELGKHFRAEQIRDHMTMHSTNRAFERYMQTEAATSVEGYQKLRSLRDQPEKGNVFKLKNRQEEM